MELHFLPVFLLVAYYNVYKLPIMMFESPYYIFDDPANGAASSPGLWLVIHNIWSMTHLLIIVLTGFNQNNWFRSSHYLFLLLIASNLFWHVCQFSDQLLRITFLSVIPSALMMYGYQRSRWMYMLGFLSAPMIQVGLELWKLRILQ